MCKECEVCFTECSILQTHQKIHTEEKNIVVNKMTQHLYGITNHNSVHDENIKVKL